VFLTTDAVQVEINPFVESSENRVFSIDAKINVDDNAKFRQKAIFEIAAKESECEDIREQKAHECGLNYVGLDGNIACLVNGAGLAMATLDIIKLYGGEPANFVSIFVLFISF
jgi:succinyl-CoA synthetase beta subunit